MPGSSGSLVGRDAQCLASGSWLQAVEVTADGDITLSLELLAVVINQFWLLFGAIWVFSMQAGFALLEAGSVRMKNTKSILVKNVMDACVGAVLWYSIGYALAYSDGNAFVGHTWDSLYGCMNYAHWFFTWSFAATSATILSGSVAERCQLVAYLVFAGTLTGVIHPVAAHWVWSPQGWLSASVIGANGLMDSAGSAVVHVCGGTSGLVAAIILGPRRGQTFDKSQKAMTGPSSVLAALGMFMLWVGWYGFNAVSVPSFFEMYTASRVATNTTLSAATSALTVAVLSNVYHSMTDLAPIGNGILAGLVASCSSASVMQPYLAILVGVSAGLTYFMSVKLLLMLKIDDPLEAVPVHLGGGVVGVIMTGLVSSSQYAPDERFYGLFMGGGAKQFGIQLAGLTAIIVWSGSVTLVVALILRHFGLLRVSEDDEVTGLDRAAHGGLAYHRTESETSLDGPQHRIRALQDVPMQESDFQIMPDHSFTTILDLPGSMPPEALQPRHT